MMADPTYKNPQIEHLIMQMTGKDRRTTIKEGHCITCEVGVTTFRDDLSRKEYTISGMCQQCQDSVFKG